MKRSFRFRKGAASLKHGSVDQQNDFHHSFRFRKGAASLKPFTNQRSFLSYLPFRFRKGAASLKPGGLLCRAAPRPAFPLP